MSVYIARDKAGNPKSPYWQYDFECSGARFSGSFNGKDGRPKIRIDRPEKEAERAEAVIRTSAADAKRELPRMSLHDAAAHYWTHEAQHQSAAESIWGYIGHLERIIGKQKFIDEIDTTVCANYVARRRTETARRKETLVTNSTVNCDIDTLVAIFKCVRKVAKLPEEAPDWGAHRLPVQERIRALSFDEEQALFASIDELRPDFHDIWEFKLIVCKRLSEVMFLEKAKIDRRARTARAIAKGGKEIVIALTDRALEIVERNWMNHPTMLFTYVCRKNWSGKGKDGKMRHQRKGLRYPFTIDGWREQWKAIVDHSGVQDFRVHDFRHTGLTRVLAATGNLKLVQDVADHKDIRSTARYAHTFTDQRREALEAAEKLLHFPENPRKDKAGSGNS